MPGILSQNPRCCVMAIEKNGGGGGFLSNGNSSDSGFTNIVASTNTPSLPFDFDVSQLGKNFGKNTAADIRSAYELFSTGQTRGRALGYAQDIQRRFTPGLLSTYGSADIRTAAANYLDSIGFPRLAQIASPVKTTNEVTTPFKEIDSIDEFFPLPNKDVTTTTTPTTEKNPFEILADILPTLFGNAVYNPPLQSQASGFTGVDTATPLSTQGSGGFTMYIIIGVLAIGAYFLYKRFA